MSIAPIIMAWQEVDVFNAEDGSVERRHAMVPVERYRKHAERQYQTGAEYPLIPLESRSRAAHNRYFAALAEAYGSLPENVSKRWENIDHFRKWVLIETGWYREVEEEFEGRDAEKYARRRARYARADNDYARIWVVQRGPGKWVTISRTAKSQDHASMAKAEFKASSDAVLDYAAALLGTPRSELNRHAGMSA